jgi:CheY-like chemotaxis protein
MARILAIDADSKRRILLATLIRDHVQADLTVVSSVRAALSLLTKQIPDLILAPALLSPQDSALLVAHVKQLDTASHTQIVTLPALDMLVEPQREERRMFGLIRRRQIGLGLQYDPGMVVTLIADALDRARLARAEREALLAHREWRLLNPAPEETALARIHAGDRRGLQVAIGRAAGADAFGSVASVGSNDANDERRAARRRQLAEIPWLSGVKLGWGADIDVINISPSGVLIETGSKFTPGSTTDLHLSGPEKNLIVPVRFIRSEVARIDSLGVRYHAAGAFTRQIDLAAPRTAAAPSSPPQALATLLADVLDEANRREEPRHLRFARGLRELVGAREVQIHRGAAVAAGGRETLYFDVPGDDRVKTTLQVIFDRNHNVTDSEFRLLKAAAWLTAAAFEFDKPSTNSLGAPEMKFLTEQVA